MASEETPNKGEITHKARLALAREERLRKQLRANLSRRKSQARVRKEDANTNAPKGDIGKE
jgi:hypothetical protein